MTEPGDTELLQRYAQQRSEAAFAELVRRHLDRVYAVAVRQVGGDRHLAEDVAQVVFTALARKASSLLDRPVLGGWLYRATRFAARDVVRAERRRRAREHGLPIMNEELTGNTAPIDEDQLRHVLDEVMDELSEAERSAVWLRFFEGRSFAEIGSRLRLSENAARMRVERALTRMYATLSRRGVKSTTAALALALARDAGIAAPAGLANAISVLAVASAAGGGATALLPFFLMTKTKIALVSAFGLAALTTLIMEVRATHELQAEVDRWPPADVEIERLRHDGEQLSEALVKPIQLDQEADELVRLRARVAVLQTRPDGITDTEMKPRSQWRNAGHATPEAAMETLAWAIEQNDLDELAKSFSFNESAKTKADIFFAGLSDAGRTKYRTPERLFAPVLAAQMKDLPVAAYQVSEVIDPGPDHVELRFWVRSNSGQERDGGTMPFVHEPDGWRFGRIGVDLKIAQIDPATGDFRPSP